MKVVDSRLIYFGEVVDGREMSQEVFYEALATELVESIRNRVE